MIKKETNEMITSLSGGAFEIRTGRVWSAGLSPYRDKDLNIHWEKCGPCHGRWFFEIGGVQYSAKQISPYLKDIQMHTEGY